MKQKTRGWIVLRNIVVAILVAAILSIIAYVVEEITNNPFLVPVIAIIVAMAAWVWIESRSKHPHKN